jgi:hypothetical protein
LVSVILLAEGGLLVAEVLNPTRERASLRLEVRDLICGRSRNSESRG